MDNNKKKVEGMMFPGKPKGNKKIKLYNLFFKDELILKSIPFAMIQIEIQKDVYKGFKNYFRFEQV